MSRKQRDQVFLDFSRWGYDQMGWAQTTRNNYYQRILRAEAWLEQNRSTSVIWATPQDLKAYLWSTKPEAGTRNGVRCALIGFGRFLEAQGYIQINNALALARLPEKRNLPQDLDRNTALRVASIASTQILWIQTLFFTFLYSGMRLEEVRTLKWVMIDLDAGWFRFHQKGGGQRDHIVHQELLPLLRRWRRECVSAEWVFPSSQKHGKPYSARYIQQIMQDLGEAAGLGARLHPHVLRHTCATLLLESGVDLRTVQQYLGHASIQSTVRYVRVRPGLLKDAAGRLSLRSSGEKRDGGGETGA